MKDRLGPSITYLQRLSPEYLDTIFQYSKWILNENAEMALEVSSAIHIFFYYLADASKIFTSEEVELPPANKSPTSWRVSTESSVRAIWSSL